MLLLSSQSMSLLTHVLLLTGLTMEDPSQALEPQSVLQFDIACPVCVGVFDTH